VSKTDRTFVLVGTSGAIDYLSSDTGNRRYWEGLSIESNGNYDDGGYDGPDDSYEGCDEEGVSDGDVGVQHSNDQERE